jgi:hypothetical protein
MSPSVLGTDPETSPNTLDDNWARSSRQPTLGGAPSGRRAHERRRLDTLPRLPKQSHSLGPQ